MDHERLIFKPQGRTVIKLTDVHGKWWWARYFGIGWKK